ncbi:MAG: ABC transporter permease [Acidobacteriia bacterium]|nr:ABC transporter permease [Terriglobia bacterium]
MSGLNWLEQLTQDMRYGLRGLSKDRGLAAIAIITLAFGIGANTAIFSFLDVLILQPLPLPKSDRLVSLYYRSTRNSDVFDKISFPDYLFYRERNRTFSGLAAYNGVEANFRFGNQMVRVSGEMVSANYFSVLGARLVAGRTFLAEEDAVPGRNPVVVLAHRAWQQYFAANRGALGQQVVINGVGFTIIGIAGPEFTGLRLDRDAQPEFWAPVMMYPVLATYAAGRDLQHYQGNTWISVTGRLKPGVNFAEAESEFVNLTSQLKQTEWVDFWKNWPNGPNAWAAMLVSANEGRLRTDSREEALAFLMMLMAIAVLVLLIACSNVASLMLARGVKRQSEFGVRLALGASKGRLFQQLLTESLMITLPAAAAGLVMALLATHFLSSFHRPFNMPLLLQTSLNVRVLSFSLVLACLTGVLFGVIPVRQSSRTNLVSTLKGELNSLPGGFRLGMQQIFIVAQVALSVVLLMGAGLFVRTLLNAQSADVTLDPGKVLLLKLNLPTQKYDQARGMRFYSNLLSYVRALPGVNSAAFVWVVPMGGRRGGTEVAIHPGDEPREIDINIVSEEYFKTVGIPLLRGRVFSPDDRAGAPAVSIINEEMARHFWPGMDPVGQKIRQTHDNRIAEIIGVVRDGRFRNYRAPLNPCFYVPLSQMYRSNVSLEARTVGNPLTLAAPIRREIQALDMDLPPTDAWTLKSFRDEGLGQERLSALLLIGAGIIAVVLVAIGLYSVLAFAVERRTHEIGIRMALGARRANVVGLVVRQGAALTCVGATLGGLVASLLSRFVSKLLYGVQPSDPVTLLVVGTSLAGVALLALYLPARRATKIDPMQALRYE